MIKTDIKLPISYTKDDIYTGLCERLPVTRDELLDVEIVRRSLNLSDKSNLHYDMTVALSLDPERERGLLNMRKRVKPHPDLTLTLPDSRLATRPVVVGAGPAGLFCALTLALAGARPILYERGLPVERRAERVSLFNTLGILDPDCNIQYGEGGAGTYSDGKLKSGAPDKYKRFVLSQFVAHGAPEEVLYSTNAHVGTDRLASVVKGLRERIISLGGEVHFSTKLVGLNIKNGKIIGGRISQNGNESDFESDTVILATGHSSTEIFELLRSAGTPLEPRGFGIGVRIEHPREYIDSLILGDSAPEGVGTASYHLVTHLPGGRSVYSFCMCPGGTVVAAAGERGGIVTNGMSEFARMADNSNSALLVSVTPDDFPDGDPLSGIALQRSIECHAFALTSGTYRAPAQRLDDFLEDKKTATFGDVKPSYPLGVCSHRLEEALPEFITDSLRAAMADFDAWLPGYNYPHATLTAPETRSTSPVRVLRTPTFETLAVRGLYPIGEGAGYAGGIVSSAREGVMCAESILLLTGHI